MPESFTASQAPAAGSWMRRELHSQPDVWERAIAQARAEDLLPPPGTRVAVIGCGTSWFMAQSYAAVREATGAGETDAFAASEATAVSARGYDAVVAISRSGTTTEVLELLDLVGEAMPSTVILGDTGSPAAGLGRSVVALPYADESSVVQTRFATSALAYLLTATGMDMGTAVEDARNVLAEPTPAELLEAEQFSFLGRGWTVGLAHEAALKMREAVQDWTESYPAMEYRHGPIAVAGPRRVTWMLGEEPPGLRAEIVAAGARYEHSARHPLAELVRVHRTTLDRATARGLDPDQPRHLTRSVVLEG